ncbi:hypothetical protein ZEAMMB73_Zm00001d017828 [Zea mays]|nr:hypothetical protein ZEAMMB73_Zm00001d017828 [Zea mays]
MSTQGNCETHGAAVPGTKDAGTGKAGQSSGDQQEEKLPKCEQVDYGSEVEGCTDDENPGKRAALVTLVGNEYCGDEDERVQVLTIVKKDEPADDIVDHFNPGTVAGYSEAKGAVGASAATSAVRPAGSRSSSFHGVTR